MDASQIITQVLAYTDNISPTDTDYADRRIRVTNLLQELFEEVVTASEWTWRRKTAQLTVLATTGFIAVPSDFGQLGNYGGIHLVESFTGSPLDHETEHVVRSARARNYQTSSPSYFAIFGEDAATFARLIQFPVNPDAFDILVDYLVKTPTVDEAGNINTVKLLPEEFHQRVLIAGLRAKTLESKGDERWQNHYAMMKDGIVEMRGAFRRKQGSIWQLPSFFGSGRR